MAGTLEFGKIISISFLYQYWEKIPLLLKGYLSVAAVVLMVITSVGIYGFLTAAYQTTSDELTLMDRRAQVAELRKSRFEEQLTLYNDDRDRVSQRIADLTEGLANNQIQYVDQETGQLVTSTSGATRTALQEQISLATEERNDLNSRIDAVTDSITVIEQSLIEATANNDLAAEVGPLRYVAGLTGWSMDQVVNIFALLLIFVFDPLAVALVISVNFLLKYEDEEESPPFDHAPPAPEADIPVTKELPKLSPTPSNSPSPSPSRSSTPQPSVTNSSTPKPITPSISTSDESRKSYGDIDETLFLQKYMDLNRNGIPDWMESDFDWDNTQLWINNPIARVYKKHIVDRGLNKR